eukprot:TRINITY_DN1808_c0_g1_i7.p1 TRINITY_DN1808_c0_g1~~TRINITY_DN1808_c0_g1_i7.p1  ORF type:complete len:208 (-),score=-2.12 TRINITY_DN1808_c0_g1_i7:1525-2148(-)
MLDTRLDTYILKQSVMQIMWLKWLVMTYNLAHICSARILLQSIQIGWQSQQAVSSQFGSSTSTTLQLYPGNIPLLPQRDSVDTFQYISISLPGEADQCTVNMDVGPGLNTCFSTDILACEQSRIIELRNVFLSNCLKKGILSSVGENQCACCEAINNFIRKYQYSSFLKCMCSTQLLCNELSSLSRLIDPVASLRQCGIQIDNLPNC